MFDLFNKKKTSALTLTAPVQGTLKDVTEFPDQMFADKVLGDGVMIAPETGQLFAPVDGTLTMVYETNHAVGITTANGAELLIHIGMDTVNLQGKGFTGNITQGQKVHAGDPLITFDIPTIKAAGYDPAVAIILLTNENGFELEKAPLNREISVGEPIMTIKKG